MLHRLPEILLDIFKEGSLGMRLNVSLYRPIFLTDVGDACKHFP